MSVQVVIVQNTHMPLNPKPCRVLYVVGQLALGGLERQLYYLLAALDHARYQPALVVWNLNPIETHYLAIEALKVPIYGFPTEWSPLSKLRAFRALARKLAPEIIHSYGFHTNFAAYYAARGTRALVMAIWRRGNPNTVLHHSDRGSQYTSEPFQRLLADHGVTCSMSRAGNVWDNAVMESFFSSLKTERMAAKTYRTHAHARADVFDYIERVYNPTRRHSTLGYLIPMEFETQAGLA